MPSPSATPSASSRVYRSRCFSALLVWWALCAASGLCRAQTEDAGEEPHLAGAQMLRGTVIAIKGSSLTIKTEGGELYQVATTDNTHVVHAQKTVKLAEIKVGDGMGAGGVLDAQSKTLHAAFVGFIDAEEVRRAQAELGKSYIAGRIVAIGDLKLTIQRLDGVKQTIAVDESTSFRRGGRSGGGFGSLFGASAEEGTKRAEAPSGESITLADIKINDTVLGKGALKNGTFVPSELHVSEPGRGRRGPGEPAAGSKPAADVRP